MLTKSVSIVTIAALGLVGLAGCQTTPTQQGAVIGGATGAAAGAIIGHQSGKQGEGALIGAAGGALVGALVGDQVDERRSRRAIRQNTAAQRGHWETRTVTPESGETYEERIWVPDN
jgi:uncharacterized protein YcfJ